METLLLFFWKSIIVSGLLTTWYMLALRGKLLHQYNRVFLLSAMFSSLTIPFLHFNLFTIPHAATGHFAPVALLLPDAANVNNAAHAAQQTAASEINWLAIAAIAIAIISLTLACIQLFRIYAVFRMCRQSLAVRKDGVNIVYTDLPQAPFTFLTYLFWNRSIPVQSEVGQLIYKHELTHIEQGHTYDKIVSQLLTCIFWFNPFYWIIQRELNIVHEFIADKEAVNDHDTEAFAMMLLQSYDNGNYLAPQHHFFSTPVKRRLNMIQTATKPSYNTLRKGMILPLIAGSSLLFSFTYRNSLPAAFEPAKKKIVVLVDPGHGGVDKGEMAGGIAEKDIALQYARRLQKLAPTYNIEVKLTRDGDSDVSLADRAAACDKIHPDVFISLHVEDEPQAVKGKNGFDIYVSGKGAQTRQSNNYSSAIFGAMEESGIITDLDNGCKHNPAAKCTACRNAALQLSSSLIQSKEKSGVYVLAHTHTPGMLIILGSMKDNDGAQQLADEHRSEAMCHAVLKGIVEGAIEKRDLGNTTNLLYGTGADTTVSDKCR